VKAERISFAIFSLIRSQSTNDSVGDTIRIYGQLDLPCSGKNVRPLWPPGPDAEGRRSSPPKPYGPELAKIASRAFESLTRQLLSVSRERLRVEQDHYEKRKKSK
jgi:hypothetical protein